MIIFTKFNEQEIDNANELMSELQYRYPAIEFEIVGKLLISTNIIGTKTISKIKKYVIELKKKKDEI